LGSGAVCVVGGAGSSRAAFSDSEPTGSEYYGAGDRADLLGSMTRESGRPWVIYVVATGVVVRLAAYQQVEASVPSAGGRGAHS